MALKQLRLFLQHKLWKAFKAWRSAIQAVKMAAAKAALSKQLFLLSPVFQQPLQQFYGLCHELNSMRLYSLQPGQVRLLLPVTVLPVCLDDYERSCCGSCTQLYLDWSCLKHSHYSCWWSRVPDMTPGLIECASLGTACPGIVNFCPARPSHDPTPHFLETPTHHRSARCACPSMRRNQHPNCLPCSGLSPGVHVVPLLRAAHAAGPSLHPAPC